MVLSTKVTLRLRSQVRFLKRSWRRSEHLGSAVAGAAFVADLAAFEWQAECLLHGVSKPISWHESLALTAPTAERLRFDLRLHAAGGRL